MPRGPCAKPPGVPEYRPQSAHGAHRRAVGLMGARSVGSIEWLLAAWYQPCLAQSRRVLDCATLSAGRVLLGILQSHSGLVLTPIPFPTTLLSTLERGGMLLSLLVIRWLTTSGCPGGSMWYRARYPILVIRRVASRSIMCCECVRG